MKIRADENISPRLVRAVQSIALSTGGELSHVRDFHAPRTADETWIPRFVVEGGQAIISADRRILARPHQMAAISEGNLIGIFLPAKWAQARGHEQAAHILWWWPRIEKTLNTSTPTQCWKIPYDFGHGALEEIVVDFAKASAARKI